MIAISTPFASRIKPVLESSLETLEHLFFDVSDVSELTPTSQVAAFGWALDLYNKLFDQRQLIRVFFPQMLFTKLSSLFLPILGS
jgi:hypothetical protein